MMLKNRYFFLFIGLVLIKLYLANKLQLGFDESHYVLYGRWIDWSYLDHPPLVGWIHFLFQWIPLRLEIQARLPAILNGGLIMVCSVTYLRDLKFSNEQVWWAVLSTQLTLGFFVLQWMLLPDSLLLTIVLALLVFWNRPRSHWFQGFLLGLAGLAKYTAIFLVPGLLLQKMNSKEFRWKNIFKIGVIAFFLIGPVLYWNLQNDGISFRYQLNRVLSSGGWDTWVQSLVAAIIFHGLFLVCFVFRGAFELRGRRSQDLWVLLPGLLFFVYSGFRGFVLPHWWGALLLPLMLVGIAKSVSVWSRPVLVVRGMLVLQIALILGLVGFVFFAEVTKKHFPEAFRDVTGWRETVEKMNEYEKEHGIQNWGVLSWIYAGRLLAYSDSAMKERFFVFDQRKDQYDIWNSMPADQQKVRPLLLLYSYDSAEPSQETTGCLKWEELQQWQLPNGTDHVRVLRCLSLLHEENVHL